MLCEPHAESDRQVKPFKSLCHVSRMFLICRKCSEALTEWGEEPAVLAGGVTLLKGLLDGLLGVLTLGNFLESLGGDGSLKTLELESVASWHQVVVVDDLDEWLDLGALGLAGLGHAAGDLGWVALDTRNDGVWVWVRLVALILWLHDDNLNIPY